MKFSQLTWVKIGSLMVAALGLIVMYAPQAQSFVTTNNMSPNFGIGITLLAGFATLILNAIHAHQLEQAVNSMPGAPVVSAPVATFKKVGRLFVLFMGLMLLASTASAGYLVANAKENTALTLPSGTAIYLMPIEGFQVGASLPTPTYGLSFNEDLVWGALNSLNGATNLSPIFGLGASLYADASGVINGNGPLVFLVGVNAVGPDLDLLGIGNGTGLVPDISATYNFGINELKITGGLTLFANLFPGTAVKITP